MLVLTDLPQFKWQFHRFMPYSESSYLTDQVLGNLPPFKWQFYRFLLLLLIFISYSGSSTFGRPGLGISTPFSNGNFTDSCSDCSYLFPTLRAQHLADQVLAGWPPINRQFHRFLLYSESSYLADQVLANLPSLSNGNCTDSWSECSYFFPTLRTIFLADQVLAGLPPIKRQFHRFLLYSGSSYLADQVLANLPSLSNVIFTGSCYDYSYFFPILRAQHLADQVLGHLSLFPLVIS